MDHNLLFLAHAIAAGTAASLLILLAMVLATYVLAQIRHSRAKPTRELIAMYAKQIDGLGLAQTDVNLIKGVFLPDLEQVILGARLAQFKFSTMAKSPIWMSAATTVATIFAGSFGANYISYFLVGIGVLGSVQGAIILIERLDQNGAQWKDAGTLEFEMKDALNELLVSTPNIPIAAQYAQFTKEYAAICKLRSEYFQRRLESTQAAAKAIADETTESIRTERQQYREKHSGTATPSPDHPVPFDRNAIRPPSFEPSSVVVPPTVEASATQPIEVRPTFSGERSMETIGDTGISIAQYIELSTGGGDDEDSGIFVGQFNDDDDFSEEETGVFKEQI
jgi:hypothetical protein